MAVPSRATTPDNPPAPIRRQRGLYRTAMVWGAVLLVGGIAWSTRSVLYPFLFAGGLAFVLAPAVKWLAALMPFHRRRPALALGLAIGYLYLISGLLLAGAALHLAPRAGTQARDLAAELPAMITAARGPYQRGAGWYERQAPATVREGVAWSSALLANQLESVAAALAARTVGVITGGVTTVLAYVVVPFWLFYVLKDRDQLSRSFYGLFPTSMYDDIRVLTQQAARVLGSFIRAQLLLSAITAAVVSVGLLMFGVKFALVLGLLAGVANLIPLLGPMLGGAPVLAVTAITRPGWTVLWVFLFLFVAQNLKAYILVPRIQGQAVRLHPAALLVLLVVAGRLFGFWGLVVVAPLASVIRDVFVYAYRRLGDEPPPEWAAASSPPVVLNSAGREPLPLPLASSDGRR